MPTRRPQFEKARQLKTASTTQMPRCSFDFTQTSHQSSARELQAFSDASLGSSTIKFEWILNTRIVRPHHDFHVRRNRSSGTLKRRVKLKWQMSKMEEICASEALAGVEVFWTVKSFARQISTISCLSEATKNYKHESSRSDSLDK